jgi:phosphatidylethanolamine/phosphatidyl-N-methylethanolamine N-methyltransferase
LHNQPSGADRCNSSKRGRPVEKRLADDARFFFRSWLDNPLRTGAVSPSGRSLARMMARYVDPLKTGPIIELGPGTGAITEALLARGVAPGRLFLIEFDPSFCKHLQRRFPGVHVIRGNAYNLKEVLGDRLSEAAASVVSSLPLLVKPEKQRLELLADAFDRMAPDGCFIQFTYGPISPMPRDKVFSPAFYAERSPPVWLNLPPARVWVYRQLAEGDVATKRRTTPAQDFFDKLRAGTEKIQIDLKREIDGAKARLAFKKKKDRPARKRSKLGAMPAHSRNAESDRR